MILVLGAKGQLGKQICVMLSQIGLSFVATDYESLDITDKSSLEHTISSLSPYIIINAAAFTDVNSAEFKSRDLAYKINVQALENICEVLHRKNIAPYIIHISTDYVFDGKINDTDKNSGYHEYDITNPVNFYGKSKRQGELVLEKRYVKYYIIRTSWLFGVYGSNFVKNIINKILNREEISVVNNQFGSPTSVTSLTNIICKITSNIINKVLKQHHYIFSY